MAVGKRKRAGFSERERFEHKSAALLQREAKKVRAFLARKAVQQLKQQRGEAAERSAKQAAQVARRERELAALKALELKQVVARAFEVTGLSAQRQEERGESEVDSDGESDGVEEAEEEEEEDDDSGFDSEEYERERGIGRAAGEGGSDEEDASGEEEERAMEQQRQEVLKQVAKSSEDQKLNETLVDRILAHKQMVPLLDAIRQWVQKEEKEEEKRIRRQERRALKRGRKETLVGGRSASAPSSLFVGSLSGRGGIDDMDDDDMGTRTGQMAGADDDIAEFLGEKKKKNRPGQMARRQKAIRQEEARKRKEDRERGIFRPQPRGDTTASKYGPSERPKKSKKQLQQQRQSKDKPVKDGKSRDAKPREARKPSSGGATNPRATGAGAKPEIEHPSWLAKQAQKEKEKVDIHAFSGKKITFD